MRRFGIRQQVAWLTLAPLLIMAISLESFFLHDRFSDMDQDLLERGELIAHQLAMSSEYGVFSNNQAFLQDSARGVLQQSDVRGVVILNPASETLASAGEISSTLKNTVTDAAMAVSNYPDQRKSSRFIKLKNDALILPNTRSDEQNLRIYHPIVPAQVELGSIGENPVIPTLGAVVVEISRLRTEELKTRMLWLTVLLTFLFLSIPFYLVYRAGLSITRPIRKLSEAVQAIGKGDLNIHISARTGINEINTLAQGMNEMAVQLHQERTILQQRIDDATQELRVKKDEAERASHDKSRFLAVASHDLRQPLHALGLYVAELQRKVSGAEQQHLVGKMEQSVEALSTLLNALLDISKLDAGAIVPQIHACDIGAMLKRVAADYQMLSGIKNIRLLVRPCAGYVTSDQMLLERILMNLVSNAIRYTYPNGCVMVACRRRGRFLRIEVRDSGVGISIADQANIFREFFQLAQPQLDASKGLGLGLTIVDRLVKLLGHRIELRSAPGKGSVFALEVPVAPHKGKASMAATQTSLDSNYENGQSLMAGKRLLVVDDDASVLSGTSSIVTSWGCVVSTAASLAQIEQLLRDGVVWDMIVSDYQLANDTTGIEVFNLVRQHQNKQIPCILISGETGSAVETLASGNGYPLLHKPVKPAKLRSLIVYLLERIS